MVHELARASATAPLIGVDGPGGSGKTTLARELGGTLGASIVAVDDFYRPLAERGRDCEIGGEYDWRRLEVQVLIPLRQERPARYQRYDWSTDQLRGWAEVPATKPIVVEGVYALRNELVDYYDYRVWVAASRATRLRRGLARDGQEARERWLDWMRREGAYVATHRPDERADRRVDGNRTHH